MIYHPVSKTFVMSDILPGDDCLCSLVLIWITLRYFSRRAKSSRKICNFFASYIVNYPDIKNVSALSIFRTK